MVKQRVVVALGRNSFGRNIPEQKLFVKDAAIAIADLVEAKYQVIITHSNGPQVGMIHAAMNEFSQAHSEYSPAPMSVCSAMSQGYIGYDLQNEIRTELLNRGIYKSVATLITQVKVDPFDKAFQTPVKTIGRFMNKEDAEKEVRKGNHVSGNEETGYQRIVSSPAPIQIYELDAIRTLADADQVVIACGGGGIPVLEQGTRLKGASAVIEKDMTAEKLAEELNADYLLFLTASEYMTVNEGTENEKILRGLSTAEAYEEIEKEGLQKMSSLPKLRAAADFAESREGRVSVITAVQYAKEGLAGKTGTIIRK